MKLSITYPLQPVFGCFRLSCMRENFNIRFSEVFEPWVTYKNKVLEFTTKCVSVPTIE